MKYFFLTFLLSVALVSGGIAHAQTTSTCPNGGSVGVNGGCNLGYTPLEPIGGVTVDPTQAGNFPKLINTLFAVLISVGALLAVLSLTFGGVQYMVSGSASGKSSGIARAKAALFGILLVAASWLILHTINPQLLNFNLNPCGTGNSTNCTNASNINSFTYGSGQTTSNSDSATPTNAIGLTDQEITKIQDVTANPDAQTCADAKASLNPQTFSQYFTYYASKFKYSSDANYSGLQKSQQAEQITQNYVNSCAAKGLI